MGVYPDCGHAMKFGKEHTRRFSADTGKVHKFLYVGWDYPAVRVQNFIRHSDYAFCF